MRNNPEMTRSWPGHSYGTRPPYDDMPPLAGTMIEARPHSVSWSMNCPHPVPRGYPVFDDGYLFKQLMERVADDATRHQILADNAALICDFDT